MSDTPLSRAEFFEIRSTHPYGFRSGEWGRVVGVGTVNGRPCYRICWPPRDTVTGRPLATEDWWVVDDAHESREFR